ncbi:hypothetical protein GW17_00035195, partial [Ensete ventricosum]
EREREREAVGEVGTASRQGGERRGWVGERFTGEKQRAESREDGMGPYRRPPEEGGRHCRKLSMWSARREVQPRWGKPSERPPVADRRATG